MQQSTETVLIKLIVFDMDRKKNSNLREELQEKTVKRQFDWSKVHFTEQNSAAKRTLIFYLNAAQSFNQSDRCWKKFYSGK